MGKVRQVVANVTRIYSPIMMSHEWPRLGRLIFTLVCSIISVTMNGFFVAAFFVEPGLNQIGQVFLASIGMSDLIISSVVLPTSSVVLLSGQWDNDIICHVLQFMAEAATYSYSLFFAMTAIESYYRLCKERAVYKAFISMDIRVVTTMLFVISFITAIVGVYMELDYDYCRRSHQGDFYFRVSTLVIFFLIPSIAVCYCLLKNSCWVRNKVKQSKHYNRSPEYEQESTANNLNIIAYFLFVAAWTPYIIVVYFYPDISDSWYYHSVWIGICRSVITSFLYGTMDKNFRRAYAHLFNYCCCKSTLSGSFAKRHRRNIEHRGDVRVHIMHQAVNANSPQRGASSSRETQEL